MLEKEQQKCNTKTWPQHAYTISAASWFEGCDRCKIMFSDNCIGVIPDKSRVGLKYAYYIVLVLLITCIVVVSLVVCPIF